MSSSDEDQNADDLLSSFNPRYPPPKNPNRPTSSPATTNTEITPPKRRGKPPKPLVVINLDSDGSQTPEPARRPRGRPKKSSSVVTTSPRARRSRAAVANYYSNSIYTGYVSESEEEASEPQTSQSKPAAKSSSSRSGEAPSTTKNLTSKSFRVVYNARGIQIGRHGYAGFEDLPNPPRILPYSPQNKPSGYAHVFRKNPHVQLLHVSFSEAEILAIIELLSSYGIDPCLSELSVADAVTRIVRSIHKRRIDQDILKKLPHMIRLQNTLKSHGFDNLLTYSQVPDFSNHQIDDLYRKISIKRTPLAQTSHLLCKAAALSRRSIAEVQAFLEDARLGNVPSRPHYICASNEQTSTTRFTRPTLLPYRNSKQLAEQLTFKKTQAWKGASNDVLDLAWSPDGSKFAVGAAAQCDEHNMQYNRSNNLILGDYQTKAIKELSDHRVPYPIVNHNNSHLYMSVTAVQWFDDTLYTSSYDKTVRIWDVSTYAGATCKRVLRHAHKVHVMARSPANLTLLATGTESTLHLWHSAGCSDLDYLAQRSTKNPRAIRDADFTPSSLAWGLSPLTQDMFVAGFSGKSYHEGNACREGLLTAWKAAESSLIPIPLQPNAQNIFDVKSHPFLSCFATGSSVSAIGTNGAGKDIRSFVRVYEPLLRPRCTHELDCPALDINDVSFCPTNRNLISASCTDATTYVWDVRNPSEILHKLSHGDAINQLDEELIREQADVGVRVALWGKSTEEFITGGSDGVLRSWNILLAPEDVHVREIAVIEDEIMSGAFSPDKSSLLIGDAAGGIHILQPASSSEPVEPLRFEYKEEPATLRSHDSGRAIGRALLETGQLSQHPQYGVGKGPAYAGPYAAWARPPETPKNMLGLTPLLGDVEALQLDRGSSAVPERADHHTVEQLRKTASIRNRDPSLLKRKDSVAHRPTKKDRTGDVIDLCRDDRAAMKPAKLSRNLPKAPVIIDLTNDTDEEEDAGSFVDDSAEDDYWFPDSGVIDANIRYSE